MTKSSFLLALSLDMKYPQNSTLNMEQKLWSRNTTYTFIKPGFITGVKATAKLPPILPTKQMHICFLPECYSTNFSFHFVENQTVSLILSVVCLFSLDVLKTFFVLFRILLFKCNLTTKCIDIFFTFSYLECSDS